MVNKKNGKEYKIEDSWYFQAKQLTVAKAKLCRELFLVFKPILDFLARKLGGGNDMSEENPKNSV